MKKVKKLVTDYFGFSPRETRGFFILTFCMILFLLVPVITRILLPVENFKNPENRQKLNSLVSLLKEDSIPKNEKTSKTERFALFPFDPNKADKQDFIRLGIASRTADIIIKYRDKGGVFKIKSDLKKIYGLKEDVYARIYPFIQLPETKEQRRLAFNTAPKEAKASVTNNLFDINRADTFQLMALKGIGSKLSKRIITFREKLGGFVNAEQYKEVYGLDTSVIKLLKDRSFIASEFQPNKISINSASPEELRSHPYIKFKLGSLIAAYRDQHGKFSSVEELKNIKVLSENDYQKLLPYIQL